MKAVLKSSSKKSRHNLIWAGKPALLEREKKNEHAFNTERSSMMQYSIFECGKSCQECEFYREYSPFESECTLNEDVDVEEGC